VRLPSASCPFCDVTIDAGALTAQYAPRRNGMQSGIKRAVIFAVGASMAAACGGETDEPTPDPDPTVQPVYGAPVDPSSSEATPTTSEPTAQPLYGAPITTDDDVTSEPLGQPEYGAPIPDDTTNVAIYGAPVAPSGTEEPPLVQPLYGAVVPPDEPDAGEADAGGDAAAPDAGLLGDATIDDPDPGPTVQPVYGAPVN
jgi:hypothetical protein